MIQLYYKVSLWKKSKKNIIVFGQYDKLKPQEIIITSKNKISYKIVYFKKRPDFYIKIKGDISKNTNGL